MSTSDVIAIAAAVIAALSAAAASLSYHGTTTAERRARMPALMFRRGESELILANVGTGPAINVIYAQGRKPAGLKKGINEPWFNPIHLRPIKPGGQHRSDRRTRERISDCATQTPSDTTTSSKQGTTGS